MKFNKNINYICINKSLCNIILPMLPNASVPSLRPLSMHLSNCSSCLQAHLGVPPQKFPYVLAPQIETHHRKQATPFDLKVFCSPQSSPAHQGTSPKQHSFWRTQQLQSLKSQLPSTTRVQSLRWDLSSCLWNSLLKSVHRSIRDVMFMTEEIVSILILYVIDIASIGLPKDKVEKLKKTKYGMTYGQVSLAAAMTRVKLTTSLRQGQPEA